MTQSIKTKSLCRRALQQRNQRVNQYCGLVTPIAVHYCRRCPEPLDDLVQVGLMGLLRAAELYQPQTATSGVPWSGVTRGDQPRRSRGCRLNSLSL